MIQLKPFSTRFGAGLAFALALAILLPGMGTGVVQAQPDGPANGNKPPVIAVVPIGSAGSTPLAALIEARLSRNDSDVLVDREHIAQVTREWELAALSIASSVSKRVEVGRLLGADILVLISESTSPSPHCEVVVSETARGLRLRTATLPTSQHPEDDVRAVEGEIEIALKKLAEGISKIHAVPPFVSMDLSGDHAHLNGAYARMVEAMLLKIPGALVVEISEAREIAAETALTGMDVGRPMPVYLMGEYRFDTENPDKLPFVRITAQRGGRKVGGREAGGLTPESAVPFIRKSVMELLETAGGGELSEPNATTEWQILAARARDHFALGYFEESAQLAEASLLLEGRQPQLHQLAMSAYGRCCWGAKKSVNETLRYYDRALAHLEEFLMQSQFTRLDPEVYNAISQAFAESVGLTNHADESTRKDVFAFRKRARNTYLRVIAGLQAKVAVPGPVCQPGRSGQGSLDVEAASREVVFVPLHLQPGNIPHAFRINGLISCGQGIDLLWGSGSACLMRSKGVLEPVFRAGGDQQFADEPERTAERDPRLSYIPGFYQVMVGDDHPPGGSREDKPGNVETTQ